MKRPLFYVLAAVLLLASACQDETAEEISRRSPSGEIVSPNPNGANPNGIWVLTQISNSPLILLLDPETFEIKQSLQVPAALSSPEALTYDGTSLWVGGSDSDASLYQLDPADGAIVAEHPNISTQGLAYANEEIYYSTAGHLYRLGESAPVMPLELSNSNYRLGDIAIADDKVYYVSREIGRVHMKNLQTGYYFGEFNTYVYDAANLSASTGQVQIMMPGGLYCTFSDFSGEILSDQPTGLPDVVTGFMPTSLVQ